MPLALSKGGAEESVRFYGVAPTVVLLPSPANLRAWGRFSGVKIINNILVQGRFCFVPFDYAPYWFSPNCKGAAHCPHPLIPLVTGCPVPTLVPVFYCILTPGCRW